MMNRTIGPGNFNTTTMVISYDEQNHGARRNFKTTTVVISYDEQNHWAREF